MPITKIVVTGGPCAGKSTASSWIQNAFSSLGYKVLFVPETATELITGGVAPWTCGTNLDYQKCQMELQLKKEALFLQAAETMKDEKILIVCDRGALDNKAYMSEEEFAAVLGELHLSESDLRDAYDGVFHLVTCAKGASEFYTLNNNGARIETVEQAAALDDRIIAAWTGNDHFRIIDNTTDFEVKMMRLIKEIASFLGESALRDNVHKYLIEYPDTALLDSLPNCRRADVIQTYLSSADGVERRIRQRGTDGHYVYYEIRKKVVGGKEAEMERRLAPGEYLRLLMEADPNKRSVRKTRYCLSENKCSYDIDIYPFWPDKAILKVSLSDPDAEIRIPSCVSVIREVTNEEEFNTNILAKTF